MLFLIWELLHVCLNLFPCLLFLIWESKPFYSCFCVIFQFGSAFQDGEDGDEDENAQEEDEEDISHDDYNQVPL